MAKPFSTYAADVLPKGFSYPQQFLEFARSGEYPNIGPWWFVDAATRAGDLMWSVRAHDGRNLVPFAKVDDGRGDVACFNGDNESGAPEVFMLVLDESKRQYSYADFTAWLEAAKADALR